MQLRVTTFFRLLFQKGVVGMDDNKLNFDDVKEILEFNSSQRLSNALCCISFPKQTLKEFYEELKTIHGDDLPQYLMNEYGKWLKTPLQYSF